MDLLASGCMKRGTTNPILAGLISDLKVSEAPIWKDVAKRLSRPRRIRTSVNVSRLNRYAKDGDTILVPGKLLAAGAVDKKLTVSAFTFSEKAREKIEAAGGKCLGIAELMKKNPKGSKVRMFA